MARSPHRRNGWLPDPGMEEWRRSVERRLRGAGEQSDWQHIDWTDAREDLLTSGEVRGATGHFGGATDYSEFESDGTLKFNGAATVYDDLPPIPVTSLKPSGAGADPTRRTFVGNISQYTFAINDIVEGSSELIHGYKESAGLDIHIHWATNGLEGVERAVNFEVEWTVANTDQAFTYAYPAATVDTTGDIVIPANTPDLSSHIVDVGEIDGTSLLIGGYVIFRFRRIALVGAGTDPAADPFIVAIGFHAQHDTVGSRTEYTK